MYIVYDRTFAKLSNIVSVSPFTWLTSVNQEVSQSVTLITSRRLVLNLIMFNRWLVKHIKLVLVIIIFFIVITNDLFILERKNPYSKRVLRVEYIFSIFLILFEILSQSAQIHQNNTEWSYKFCSWSGSARIFQTGLQQIHRDWTKVG